MENIVPGPRSQMETSNRPQGLQTHRPHLSHNEDTRETAPLLHQAQRVYIH